MRTIRMRRLCFLVLTAFLLPGLILAQQPKELSLWDAYRLARENYPRTKQRGLIEKTKEYTLQNAARGYLPQLTVGGQATLQTDVNQWPAKLAGDGYALPQYSKDQYKLFAEADQVLYDGGLIRAQQEAATITAVIAEKGLDVELHTLFSRVEQLYFGVLLFERQLLQNDTIQERIYEGLAVLQRRIDTGAAFIGGVDELEAQLLQAQDANLELHADRKAYLHMLMMLTGYSPSTPPVLVDPPELSLQTAISRPDLDYYDYQKRNYDLQEKIAAAQVRPRISLFAQGGYGRPGLNIFSNDPAFYAIGGVRMTWAVGGWYTLKRRRQLADIGRRGIDLQKETFLLNTTMEQEQAIIEVLRYTVLSKDDGSIINLRTSARRSALVQLSRKLLSAHDYLTQVMAEDQARQAGILHQVRLRQSQYSYQTLIGH